MPRLANAYANVPSAHNRNHLDTGASGLLEVLCAHDPMRIDAQTAVGTDEHAGSSRVVLQLPVEPRDCNTGEFAAVALGVCTRVKNATPVSPQHRKVL